VIDVISDLLGGTRDINIFATRILCKMPEIGPEVPWHQDSRYYNMNDLKVLTFWLGKA
jgi:hypothetical protein